MVLNTSNLSTTTPRRPKLKVLPFAILVFYNVSGGPFGLEQSLRAAGNLFTLLGFTILPFIWSIPEALMTAELGSAFAEDASGGVAWVEHAFGYKMGLLCGYWSYISGATDNAIYPALFMDYLVNVWSKHSANAATDDGYYDIYGKEDDGWVRFAILSSLSIALSCLNYTGLEIVGMASIIVCIIAMSPFIIMILLGLPQVEPHRWLELPEYWNTTLSYDSSSNGNDNVDFIMDDDSAMASGPLPLVGLWGILWRPFLNNTFWNLNSFDAAASFASEVENLHTAYPKGIFVGFILSILAYLLPLLVVTGATNYQQSDWTDGSMGSVAMDIGGAWLGGWIIFAAGISNLALFEAEMSADAYQLMGMADRGYLPSIFTTRSKFGTPTYGILVGTLIVVAMSVADFTQLIEMLNFNYALALLMEYAAFAKLRYTHKDLIRPYRVSIPDWSAILFIIPPCLGILTIFAVSSWITYLFAVSVLIFGIAVYHLQQIAKQYDWCEFNDTMNRDSPQPTTAIVSSSSNSDSDGGVIHHPTYQAREDYMSYHHHESIPQSKDQGSEKLPILSNSSNHEECNSVTIEIL